MRMLDKYVEDEVKLCLQEGVVDSDQAVFTQIFLKYHELFDLHFGDWGQLFTNYFGYTENKPYINYMFQQTDDHGKKEILKWLSKHREEQNITNQSVDSPPQIIFKS